MPTLVRGSLPPGAVVYVIDKLSRIRKGGKTQGRIVRVAIVPDTGVLSLSGLRDSVYALLFHALKHTGSAVYALDVGDPALFREEVLYAVPPAVVLLSADSAAVEVEVVWTLPPGGWNAAWYEVLWRIADSGKPWSLGGQTTNGHLRTLCITGLPPDTDLQIAVLAKNQQGRHRGRSNVLKVRTSASTAQGRNLVLGGSFEAGVWE